MAEQIYSHSWVSQEYLNGVIRINRGSSAGYPLADLIYSLAMAQALLCLRSTLADAGLQSSISIGTVDTVVHETSYVDDMAQPVLGPASTLIAKVAQITTKIFCVYSSFGLDVNFKPGKSECIMAFKGPGSKAARARSSIDGDRVPLPDLGDDVFLNIVGAYKHVGTQCSVSADITNEVSTRLRIISTESCSLRKILRRVDLPLNRKVHVMQAYVLSKGLFQAGTWPALPILQYKRIHAGILKMYRDITRQYVCTSFDIGSIFSDSDLIYEYGFMCPMTMLRFSRMSLYSRLVAKQPPVLLELVRALASSPKTWAASVVDDLKWLNLGSFWGSGPVGDYDVLHSHVAANPIGFTRRMKEYCQKPFANLAGEVPDRKCVVNINSSLSCHICNRLFPTRQQLNLHLFKTHSVKNPLHVYVSGTHCTVCLKEFHSRERVLNHIRYRSAVCRANLLLRGPVISQAEVDVIEQLERDRCRTLSCAGRRRHHVSRPALQLQGPLLPIVPLNVAQGSHHPLGIGHAYLPS